jgi:branched-chain amino acid transport system permease protein
MSVGVRSSSIGRAALAWALFAAILLALPVAVRDSYLRFLVTLALLYAVLASNWDLTLGYAGIFNFAHIALFALGAYTTGILTSRYDMSPWIGILAAIPMVVLASVIVYLPTLRLRGIYIALITFVFGQLCLHLVLSRGDITGGSSGLVAIPPIDVNGYTLDENGGIGYYYLALGLLLCSTVYLRRAVNAHWGKSIVALRDSENLAVSRGISVVRQRLLAFVFSSIFTGLTGAVYAHFIGIVSPELFGFNYVALLSMILLGGIGTIFGPILGAAIMTFVSESLEPLGPWRFMIVSTLIVVILRFLPGGLLSLFTLGHRGYRRAAGHGVPAPRMAGRHASSALLAHFMGRKDDRGGG